MSKTLLITGSTSGLGSTTAQVLHEMGHRVVLHARSQARAAQSRSVLDAPVVVGDLSSLADVEAVAEQVRSVGSMDVVIHNAVFTSPAGEWNCRRVRTNLSDQRPCCVRPDRPHPLTLTADLPDVRDGIPEVASP
jgi:NAD(P)-dependent dehydrogenase (short-subunit alcohol dehydrogenase family)